MAARAMQEFTCDLCGDTETVVPEKTVPEGWVVIKRFDNPTPKYFHVCNYCVQKIVEAHEENQRILELQRESR